MDLGFIIISVLFVIIVFLIARWACGKLKLNIDETILQVAALILLALILIGKVKLPF